MKVDAWEEIITSIQSMELKNVQISGVMGMASFTKDQQQISQEFKGLRDTFESLRPVLTGMGHPFETVSMGMSNDYKIALDHGSTMVRVGSYLYNT